MEDSRELSVKIMEALKPILPKGVGFIIVHGEASTGELSVTGNMPDNLSIVFLESAISTIKEEPAESLEAPPKNNASSN